MDKLSKTWFETWKFLSWRSSTHYRTPQHFRQ